MKRFISILLAFCILLVNTGWALTTHYCMGERVGINLQHTAFANGEHECAKCGMTKTADNNGCCKDEHFIIKASDATVSVFLAFQINPVVPDLPVSGFTLKASDLTGYTSVSFNSFQPHGPPGYSRPPLFIRNCVFRI